MTHRPQRVNPQYPTAGGSLRTVRPRVQSRPLLGIFRALPRVRFTPTIPIMSQLSWKRVPPRARVYDNLLRTNCYIKSCSGQNVTREKMLRDKIVTRANVTYYKNVTRLICFTACLLRKCFLLQFQVLLNFYVAKVTLHLPPLLLG